ncbi:MAG TPA: carboxypeptidase-like regulatory domain-containing protein [Puia sp.]
MAPALTGSILDPDHKAPAGVTVSLHQLPDSALVATTLSNGDGHFSFPRVRAGNYYLEIRSVSYQVFYSGTIGVSRKSLTLQPFILTAIRPGSLP